jgi:hypothetical protein
MKGLLKRYDELRRRCVRYGGFHPDSENVCYQALQHTRVDSIAVALAALLDDMALALQAAPTQVETQAESNGPFCDDNSCDGSCETAHQEIALNTTHKDCHKAADAFWQYWRENGVPHKKGYYESTWGAINQALRYVGVKPHVYLKPRIEVSGTSYLSDCIEATPAAPSTPPIEP